MSEPIPVDAITAPWWEATRERRLLLQSCESCGGVQHPPRAICRRCGATALGWREASGEATIDSFTVVARQILDELPAPYVVARVRLAEGPLLLTNVVAVEPASLRCDMPVVLSWRDLPDGRRLPTFQPHSRS